MDRRLGTIPGLFYLHIIIMGKLADNQIAYIKAAINELNINVSIEDFIEVGNTLPQGLIDIYGPKALFKVLRKQAENLRKKKQIFEYFQ